MDALRKAIFYHLFVVVIVSGWCPCRVEQVLLASSSSASANGGHDDAENADLLPLLATHRPNALTEAIHPLSQLKRQPQPFMALPWFYFLVRDKRQLQASREFALPTTSSGSVQLYEATHVYV
ncbi:hypothetical protein GOP47_0001571 [Adiantum capillus-veneris]|uniref:Secreted protein n=1 Tax=Adiantum capillus-veneris TaxID=13818 RepID=A0A9D4V9Z0_ADICA|nr:hypothetical protein GOP47_0001571 [Adiantum capillus-veneris]